MIEKTVRWKTYHADRLIRLMFKNNYMTKSIYSFNVISIKISVKFFTELEKLTPRFT